MRDDKTINNFYQFLYKIYNIFSINPINVTVKITLYPRLEFYTAFILFAITCFFFLFETRLCGQEFF